MNRRARNYVRDSRGRFASTPGRRVVSALNEAEIALLRAEQGVREIGAAQAAHRRHSRRRVRKHALAGAALGALAPAPRNVSSASGAAAFGVASIAAGYQVGAGVGVIRNKTAGRRVRR